MKEIWRNLKRLYNRWLFEKYGHVKGDYENIPVLYMLCPLWSPSLYLLESMEKTASEFLKGFEEGLKKKQVSSEDDENDPIVCKDCKHALEIENYGYYGESIYLCGKGMFEKWGCVVYPSNTCKKGERKEKPVMSLAEQIAVSLGIEEDNYENQDHRDAH